MTDIQRYVRNEIIIFAIFFGLIFIFTLIVWFAKKNHSDKNKLKKSIKETILFILSTVGLTLIMLSIAYYYNTCKIVKIKTLINEKDYNIWYNGEILNGESCDAHKISESNYELDNEKRLIIVNEGVLKYDKE